MGQIYLSIMILSIKKRIRIRDSVGGNEERRATHLDGLAWEIDCFILFYFILFLECKRSKIEWGTAHVSCMAVHMTEG